MRQTPDNVAASVTRRDPTTTWHYDLQGYHAAVMIPDRAAQSLVLPILGGFGPLLTVPAEPITDYALRKTDDTTWDVAVDGQVVYGTANLADAVIALEWHLVTDMLADRRDSFHLHAAALAAPSSSTSVLIAGESGSGKTTLTLGLMARGFLPYNDDITLMDPATCAPLPFHRAFHIDAQTESLVMALPSPPDWDFGNAPPGYFLATDWATVSWPIETVLFPRRVPGEIPHLNRLSVSDAASRLLMFSTTLRQSPALALHCAARIVAQARCYTLVTGDLSATLDLVSEQILSDIRDRA